MGYRSDVAFCLTVDEYDPKDEEKYQTYKKMLGFFKLSEFYRIVSAGGYKCVESKELGWSWRCGSIYFCASGWKWYDGYDAVEAYEQLWEQMIGLAEGQSHDGERVPISGRFVRSGEEIEDIVYDEFGSDPDYEMAYVSKVFDFQRNDVLGETESEKEPDEQVPADAHPCGQDANQEAA